MRQWLSLHSLMIRSSKILVIKLGIPLEIPTNCFRYKYYLYPRTKTETWFSIFNLLSRTEIPMLTTFSPKILETSIRFINSFSSNIETSTGSDY
jgi:hypothetical protein